MSHYRQRFLQLALDSNALCFGEFTLKSGRISPYFFNAGHFNSGAKTAALAQCYADAIDAANMNFDLVFGPVYRGFHSLQHWPASTHWRERDLLLTFNRKEVKNHGEGGTLIGAPLNGRQDIDYRRRHHRRHSNPRGITYHPQRWRYPNGDCRSL